MKSRTGNTSNIFVIKLNKKLWRNCLDLVKSIGASYHQGAASIWGFTVTCDGEYPQVNNTFSA